MQRLETIVIQSFVIEAACEVLKHSPTFICTRTDKSLCISACMTVVARIGLRPGLD